MEESHELDMEKTDRRIWLMKCPVVVAKTWEKLAPSSSSYSSSDSLPNLAKVVLDVDPLRPDYSPEVILVLKLLILSLSSNPVSKP